MAETTTPAYTLDDRSPSAFSLEQQARILASLGNAVIATDAAGTIRFWNHAAEALYGWAAAEVVGCHITTITPGPMVKGEAEAIMEALARGESWRGAFTVQRKDGTTFLAEVTDTPVLDDQNTLIGVVGVSVDLTPRRRAEDRARFLAEAARALAVPLETDEVLAKLASLPLPAFADLSIVYRLGQDGVVHRAASAHVDPSRQRFISELERRYPVHPASNTFVARVLRTHEALIFQDARPVYWEAPDEDYARIVAALDLCSLIVLPLMARSRPQGVLVLGMAGSAGGGSGRRFEPDDLRVAESLGSLGALALDNAVLLREAQHARSEAEAANRAKSAFLAAMSHELRTPLNAIAGYVELMEMELRGPVTEAQRIDLARIRRSQQHLTGLIDDVLNFVRSETGHLPVTIEDVSLATVVQRVEELVLPQLQRKGLRFVREPFDPALPVRADAEKLRQVLLNLLTNAIKYTPAGGEITLSVRDDATTVRITVRDTGVGIPSDMLAAIFEPFVQVGRRSSAPADGVGLGLAISRDFARRMGGDITVESMVGVGSTFALTLPKT